MPHTFIHDDAEKVERCVREHYFDYIRSGLKGHIQSLPQKPSEEEIQKIVEHSVQHQRRNSALFGDVEHCRATVQRLRAARGKGSFLSGGTYLYDLPWYAFIGAPGSGKTTALRALEALRSGGAAAGRDAGHLHVVRQVRVGGRDDVEPGDRLGRVGVPAVQPVGGHPRRAPAGCRQTRPSWR